MTFVSECDAWKLYVIVIDSTLLLHNKKIPAFCNIQFTTKIPAKQFTEIRRLYGMIYLAIETFSFYFSKVVRKEKIILNNHDDDDDDDDKLRNLFKTNF